MTTTSSLRAAALLAALSLAAAATSHAQISFNVTVDTSQLWSVSNPVYLDFQLNDGSGLGDGNNTATISNFDFGGGSAQPSPNTFGGASGDLWSGVTITDSNAFNELFQPFTPGDSLTFNVTLTTQIDTPIPDEFSFAILDSSLSNLPTDALGTDALVSVNIDSANPTISAFATLDGSVAAPTIVPVPEPSTYGIFAGVLLVGL